MGIADRYILRQVLAATIFAVIVLCGVFLMGTIFKEARSLLVGKNPSIGLILQFIWTVMPLSLMFMIPCGFLASILITMGRLSSNNELTALKMSGKSLYRISLPIFLLSLVFSGVNFWMSSTLAPEAKALQKKILYEAVQTDPNKFLDPGVVQNQLKGKILFVERREGNDIFGLHAFESDPEDATNLPSEYIYARQAKLFIDEEAEELRLRLYDAAISTSQEAPVDLLFIDKKEPLIFKFNTKKKKSPKVTSMTSFEIHEELERGVDPELVQEKKVERLNSLTNEINGRYAFSLSCVSFAFIGIPLAVSSKRSESSVGFIISIAIALVYFSFFIIANDKREDAPETIQILYWAPNIIAVLLGCFLFRRSQKK